MRLACGRVVALLRNVTSLLRKSSRMLVRRFLYMADYLLLNFHTHHSSLPYYCTTKPLETPLSLSKTAFPHPQHIFTSSYLHTVVQPIVTLLHTPLPSLAHRAVCPHFSFCVTEPLRYALRLLLETVTPWRSWRPLRLHRRPLFAQILHPSHFAMPPVATSLALFTVHLQQARLALSPGAYQELLQFAYTLVE